jgi:hypothetical protein
MTPDESIAWHPTHPGGSTDILPAMADLLLPMIPRGGVYVEIGVFFGRNLSFVGLMRPDLTLVAIDPWDEGFIDAGEVLPVGPDLERCRKYGGLFAAFLGTMQEHAPEVLARTRVIRAPSHRGMLVLEDNAADLVFIDGAHDAKSVGVDILEAMRVCKPGGIIAGHDSCWGNEVAQISRDMLPDLKLAPWPLPREGWEPGCSSVFWARSPEPLPVPTPLAAGVTGVTRRFHPSHRGFVVNADGSLTSESEQDFIEHLKTLDMTPEQREQQRRSFAFGNVHLSNDSVTRAMIDAEADAIAESDL